MQRGEVLRLAVAAALAPAGVFAAIPTSLQLISGAHEDSYLGTGSIIALLIVGLTFLSISGILAWGLLGKLGGSRTHENERDVGGSRTRDFSRALVGTGYALFFTSVVFAAFVISLIDADLIKFSGTAGSTLTVEKNALYGPPPDVNAAVGSRATSSTPDTGHIALLVVVSVLGAITGSLFFIANSLRSKLKHGTEPFSPGHFWHGLWFRLGEAVLFSIVAFLVIWTTREAPDGSDVPELLGGLIPDYTLLPIVGVLLGISVKSGERLIFEGSRRIFDALGAVLGIDASNRAPHQESNRADTQLDSEKSISKKSKKTNESNGDTSRDD